VLVGGAALTITGVLC